MKTISLVMKNEHNNILPVVIALEKEAVELKESGELNNTEFYLKFIEFQRRYTDGIHHYKEEEIIFPILTKHEATKDNPDIKLLLHQHILSRSYIENIEVGINSNNIKLIYSNALEYSSMIQEHITREDQQLFPLVEQLLPKEIKDGIIDSFKISEASLPKDTIKKLLLLAEELTN